MRDDWKKVQIGNWWRRESRGIFSIFEWNESDFDLDMNSGGGGSIDRYDVRIENLSEIG